MIFLAAIWLAAGAVTYLPMVESRDPWWLIALCVASWPIFAAIHFLPLEVTLAWGIEEGEDDEGF